MRWCEPLCGPNSARLRRPRQPVVATERESMTHPAKDDPQAEDSPRETPRHGFQGDRAPAAAGPTVPAGLTVAISREAGARGGSIGRRVARKLGWGVYDQELLEYMAQETAIRHDVVEPLTPQATDWVEARLQQLLREQNLSQH